jgi:L-ascorbate metabolism protein UlaG (beta-lactamase superfamily)
VDVRLDWLGTTTFRLTVGDLVIFLDGYFDRVPAAPPVGLSTAEVERADVVLVGHSHFDHLAGVERIAKQTGATVVGSYETSRILAAEGVPQDRLVRVSGGEPIRLSDDVMVRVYPSLHSCTWSGGISVSADEECFGDLGVTYQEREARTAASLSHVPDDPLAVEAFNHMFELSRTMSDGGPLAFMVETPAGSILWKDSPGHWRGVLSGLRPDVALLGAGARPNVDGEPHQGSVASFVASEVATTRAKRVALCHHDDWFPPFTAPLDTDVVRWQVAQEAPGADLLELDYLEDRAILARL